MRKMRTIGEGAAKIKLSKGVFYNPEMEICRDISSIAVGAVGEKIDICDAFSATGIRGIRYKKENKNVGKVTFVELSKKGTRLIKENIRLNNVRGATVVRDDANRFLFDNEFGLVEVDPFGSPVPYLYSTIRSFKRKKAGYLSVTATDTAVLCGAHRGACIKNYGAMPIDNEFCHETGARILIGKMARTASEFNFGIVPFFSFSHRHFIKVFVRLERGAEKAIEGMKSMGYLSYCEKCTNREWSPLVLSKKCRCGHPFQHGGPLWLGKLGEKNFIKSMRDINDARNYALKKNIGKILWRMEREAEMPPFYYDLHLLCKKMGIPALSIDKVIEKIRKKGYLGCRTHFRDNGIKTDASLPVVKRAIREGLR